MYETECFQYFVKNSDLPVFLLVTGFPPHFLGYPDLWYGSPVYVFPCEIELSTCYPRRPPNKSHTSAPIPF